MDLSPFHAGGLIPTSAALSSTAARGMRPPSGETASREGG
jgi:hypothetical protein